MKRLLLLLLLAASTATAAPRVGTHDGYTRVVFDLPRPASASTRVTGQSVTVKLGLTLPAEQGRLSAPGVTAYAVAGGTVTVTLARGHAGARVQVIPPKDGQSARLVIDVPTSAAAARVPATPVRSPAPPAAVTRPASTANLARPRVVLDPGHGGVDPGMQSRWVQEHAVTLDVALRVRDVLRQHGVDVVMTRETNTDLSADKATDLDLRSKMATNDKTSAYVSIHVNASTDPAGQGIETYYFGQPLGGGSRSVAVTENGGGSIGQELTRRAADRAQSQLGDLLAQAKLAFSRQLAQKVQAHLVSATGAFNRGVQTDAFYVIRYPTTPAILIEIGFGSSPVEGPKLAQPAYRDRVAQAIARAILEFLNRE
ncbi:N-acetylmuramoyl-L-alanine amidase [Deinococcus metallilatus]|uniref:N-acetylmuramoyl-L-alanine amidase n=1 Tax=Deinococcus metallilatus TaxID=1211322 RepID=A0AAJ5F4A1_9DEIO|nr:N-acetylmuramoyl-L-alanine amidase [Deinococcus metallilatus]MBB5297399.1 N-acetylmuramoyl-L-alanine amidase [Deinococcus metallilatus]QBY08783.1 N-acetylmuramoyl-L-alanine amidase [Deinococcus metallilatus]RXJ10664.1 N-acetylmuramoyl-L-alanine amidase [Deinococcus metallilatus]TLK26634.1 N-acetylmuramoyl-L-alanine amidase [Deinococcus metallilatus]GMA17049.1 N-acetylmuramoyl-L-alanine amidase [Deinococcus metallilatus]